MSQPRGLNLGNCLPLHSACGDQKRGHYKRGLFTAGISRISKFSRIFRVWSDSPLFSTVWGLSRISLEVSKFSRISRTWRDFLADCANSSPPLIFRKFQGFGGIWANLGKFGKFRENSGEFSGIQWGFVWRLV